MSSGEENSSQIVMSSRKHRGEKYPPMAFTEHGVAMLSSVLNSPKAIEVNIQIIRVFIRMRKMIAGYAELLQKIEALEAAQAKSNGHIENIYDIIKELLEPAVKNRKPIGFKR